jgi:amino acid transporter
VVIAFLLALWGRAYSVIVSISTIGLYAAYGIPIFLALRARRRGRMVVGPWNLGRWSTPINVGALIWVVLITILFVLPPNERTGYTFAGLLVLLTTTWVVVAQDRFRGPPGLNSAP